MDNFINVNLAYRAAAENVKGLTQDKFFTRVAELCAHGKIDSKGYRLESGRFADPHVQVPIPADEWSGAAFAHLPPGAATDKARGWVLQRCGSSLWAGVCLKVSDVESAFSKKPQATRGRPKKLAWENEIYPEIFRLMDFHGEFSIVDPEWRSQACLEDEIAAIIEKKLGEAAVPVESTIRIHVAEALKIWRDPKADK